MRVAERDVGMSVGERVCVGIFMTIAMIVSVRRRSEVVGMYTLVLRPPIIAGSRVDKWYIGIGVGMSIDKIDTGVTIAMTIAMRVTERGIGMRVAKPDIGMRIAEADIGMSVTERGVFV